MDGPGTTTWDEFVDDAEKIVRLSDAISDHWKFVGDKKVPGQAYLTRQEKIFVPNNWLIDPHLENENEADNDDEEWDRNFETCVDPFEASCPKEKPLIIEHHILWSMSYSVPVIYFNGWDSDFPGINPVSVETAQRVPGLAYGELSQAVHPILGQPFLYLHPCGTRELLLFTKESANKLVSWLSTVAPAALRLKLRPEYYQLTLNKETGFNDNQIKELEENDVHEEYECVS